MPSFHLSDAIIKLYIEKQFNFKGRKIMEKKMSKRITLRLNEELLNSLKSVQDKGVFNLSRLIRKALEEKLTAHKSIDNSLEHIELEKENENK